MKLIIVVFAIVAVTIAAPVEPEEKKPVELVRYDVKREEDGGYNFQYETSDGVVKQETGELKEVPNEKGELVKVIIVRGSYTVLDDEGHPIATTYTADENGFLADGENIPKVPETRK